MRRSGNRALGWPVVALGLAIALPWLAVDDPQGLGFRLRIVAFVPMALGAAIVASALPIPRRDAVLAVLAAALFALGAARDLTEGEVVMHPALAAAAANAAGKIPPGATVIVPERRILYPVQWYTRAPVSLRPEPVPPAHRVRVLGLAFIGGAGSPLDRALDAARHEPSIDPPIGLHADYRNGLVLVTEPTWDWLLAHVPDATRAYFERWPTLWFSPSLGARMKSTRCHSTSCVSGERPCSRSGGAFRARPCTCPCTRASRGSGCSA